MKTAAISYVSLLLTTLLLPVSLLKLHKSNNWITDDYEIVKLSKNPYQFLEGPIWDKDNHRLIFSEVLGNRLLQWTPDVGIETYMEPSNYAGGNVFDINGDIISCQGGARSIARIDKSKTMHIIASQHNNNKFNSPNDVVIKSDGTIWFTDPDYGLLATYGEKANDFRETPYQQIFKYDPSTDEVTSVSRALSKPNGLTFSADESKLYVGNSAENDRKLVVFDVTPTNELQNLQVLSTIDSETWGIDGLKLGPDDNLYAACGDGVNIFNQQGQLLRKLKTDFEVTNLCFGGQNNEQLFLTGHQDLYYIKLK